MRLGEQLPSGFGQPEQQIAPDYRGVFDGVKPTPADHASALETINADKSLNDEQRAALRFELDNHCRREILKPADSTGAEAKAG